METYKVKYQFREILFSSQAKKVILILQYSYYSGVVMSVYRSVIHISRVLKTLVFIL
jgi:hypothetical protein